FSASCCCCISLYMVCRFTADMNSGSAIFYSRGIFSLSKMANQVCDTVGKQCVAIDFLEVRNKSLFQSGLLALFSLTGIIFAWWLLRECEWITWLITV